MDATDIAAIAGAVIVAATLPFIGWQSYVAARQMRIASEVARREALERVFDDWYSSDLFDARTYFNRSFRPLDWPAALQQWPITVREMLANLKPEDGIRLHRLLYFFDRLGNLVLRGSFPSDSFLAMQHLVGKLYIMLCPFLLETRTSARVPPDPLWGGGLDTLFAESLRTQQGMRIAELTKPFQIPAFVFEPKAADPLYKKELLELVQVMKDRLPPAGWTVTSQALNAWNPGLGGSLGETLVKNEQC